MASKKKQEPKNSRRWTECELEIFAGVLAEPENCFAVTLEKLALKKSSNNEVFDHYTKCVCFRNGERRVSTEKQRTL